MNVRWWRVAVLAAITLAASYGALRQFNAVVAPKPSPPVLAEDDEPLGLTALRPGPLPGDLRGLQALAESAFAQTEGAIAEGHSASASTRTTVSTKPAQPARPAPTKRPDNPFNEIPGGGPLEKLCKQRKCR